MNLIASAAYENATKVNETARKRKVKKEKTVPLDQVPKHSRRTQDIPLMEKKQKQRSLAMGPRQMVDQLAVERAYKIFVRIGSYTFIVRTIGYSAQDAREESGITSWP